MLTRTLIGALALASAGLADDAPKCGPGNSCPEKYPCCDSTGQCGNGIVCVNGCDPRYSFEPGACMPMPQCQNKNWDFKSTDGIVKQADYMGDADKDPWYYVGDIEVDDDEGGVRLTMKKDTTGTVLTSTHFLWYGNMKATLKTSHLQGVVTDFILMSDVKDEIDYEFVGNNLNNAQTNYYFQGWLDYQKEVDASVDDTYDNFHTYEVDWTEDRIEWRIDGETKRTLKKEDTKNQTTGEYNYPQTPARLQLGIWPGGGDGQGQGTVEWAGGKIDWDSDQIGGDGYYYALVKSVEMTCYDAPSGTSGSGSKSYVYTDSDGMGKNVALSDNSTVLESLDGTGLNPEGSDKKKNSTSSVSAPNVSAMSKSSKSVPNVSEKSKSKTQSKSVPDVTGSDSAATASATMVGGDETSGSGDSGSTGSGSGSGSAAAATASGSGSGSAASSSSGSMVTMASSAGMVVLGLFAATFF
uniref:Crh-like protein n=1 Tax=Blastobotrys adeninivorans TaxID=409370 RepID=A0A060T7L3_BLAAD